MTDLSPIRECLSCGTEIYGEQVSKDDAHFLYFSCFPCDEEWYENIKYCLPEYFHEQVIHRPSTR